MAEKSKNPRRSRAGKTEVAGPLMPVEVPEPAAAADESVAPPAGRNPRRARGGGLPLVEIAGGLQIMTRPDLNEWVRRLFHERKNTRLSVQSLETLAVIAYRQPVTAAEINEIRGVNTSGGLSTTLGREPD